MRRLNSTRAIRTSKLAAGIAVGCTMMSSTAHAGDPIAFTVSDTAFANASTNVQPAISIDSLWLDVDETRYRVFTDPRSNIAQYFRTLAGPYPIKRVRVGAKGADHTYWTRGTEARPGWADRGRIKPSSIDALNAFSLSSGYSVVLHTNLERFIYDGPALRDRTLDMVDYASEKLGSRLTAVVIGNEPNFYYTNASTFWTNWNSYRTKLRTLPHAANVPLYGPATSRRTLPFNEFVASQAALKSQGGVTIAGLAHHDYYLYNCSANPSPAVTIDNLLDWQRYSDTRAMADDLSADARNLGVPAVIEERNNVACGGKQGVSDVFAAALWALDSTLLIARSGVSRQYFHSSFGVCGGAIPFSTYYTPFCAANSADAEAGVLRAAPLYYGLLAAHVVGDGTFLNTTITADQQARTRIYALRQGSRLTLVLVNVEGSATQVTATLDKAYATASRANLQAPSRSSTTGITLGGSAVASDGTFGGTVFAPVSLSAGGTQVSVSVPAYSAAILRIS